MQNIRFEMISMNGTGGAICDVFRKQSLFKLPQSLPLFRAEQNVVALRSHIINSLFTVPAITLHQVTTDQCSTACSTGLAVYVHRSSLLPVTFQATVLLDKANTSPELLLARSLEYVGDTQLQKSDITANPVLIHHGEELELIILVHRNNSSNFLLGQKLIDLVTQW